MDDDAAVVGSYWLSQNVVSLVAAGLRHGEVLNASGYVGIDDAKQ